MWGGTPAQWSGLKLYVTAIVAFAVGRWLSENLTEKSALLLASVCAAVCFLQLVFTVAQSRGVMLLRAGGPDTENWITSEGRMVGLFSHPAILGKTVFLLLCFLLPLSTCRRPLTRRLTYTAVAFGSLATLFTLSRANILAIGIAIVLWVLLSGRASSIAARLGVLAVSIGLIVLNGGLIGALQDRQRADPGGGYRDRLLQTGLGQIESAPFTGTGPNFYTDVVGRYDRLAAAGFPVHNSFLYPAAELGIPLAILLFVPIVLTIVVRISRIRPHLGLEVQTAALLSIFPGLLLIAWTGWGMIATEALPLWFMGFGFLAANNNFFNRAQPPHINSEALADTSTART